MPCSSGYGDGYGFGHQYQASYDYPSDVDTKQQRVMKEQLDLATRLLCQTCKALSIQAPKMIEGELKQWWEKHKIHDALLAYADSHDNDTADQIRVAFRECVVDQVIKDNPVFCQSLLEGKE